MNPNQGGCARPLIRVIAYLLAAILVIGLPATLLLRDWGAVIFSPEVIATAINERFLQSGLFGDMVIEAMLAREGQDEGLLRAIDFLDDAGRRALVESLVPPGWGEEQVSSLVKQLYDWIDSDQPAPKLALEVQPIKERLLGGGAESAMLLLLESWPPCQPDQIGQIRQEGAVAAFSVLCQPPEPLRTAVLEAGTALILDSVRGLPPLVDLRDDSGATRVGEAQRLKEGIRLVRAVAAWSWLLPMSMLGLITAAVVRSLSALLRWWGAPLLGAGVASFFAAFALRPLIQELTLRRLLEAQLPRFLREAFLAIGSDLLDAVMGRLLLQAILLALLGSILLGVGAYLKRRERSKTG